MTTTDENLEVSADEQQAPPEDQEPQEPGSEGSEAGESAPRPEPTAREKELEQRLRRQGTELANARRLAAQAVSQATELRSAVAGITERQNQQDKDAAERRERERQNYLNSLPPDKRYPEELKLLRQELNTLRETGTRAAQSAQAPAQAPGGDPEIEYLRARAQEIMFSVASEFEIEFTQEDIQSLAGTNAWDTEDTFQAALLRMAAKKVKEQSGGTMPKSNDNSNSNASTQPKAAAQGAGAGSPASPRAAGRPSRKPTEEDVKQAVAGYNSSAGPKANIAKLKEMRSRM